MRLGFIGCGNMAGAIIAGIIKKGLVSPDEIYGSNSTLEHANATHERLGIQTSTDNTLVAGESDIVFLCVKPQQYEAVIDQIKDHLHEHQILVSIAPGKTLAWLGEKIGHPQKIVRVMPNTPALVGEGTTAFCPGASTTPGPCACTPATRSTSKPVRWLVRSSSTLSRGCFPPAPPCSRRCVPPTAWGPRALTNSSKESSARATPRTPSARK